MEKLPRKELIFDMLVKEPNDVFLNYALAMEHLSTSDFKEAEIQFKKVLEIDYDLNKKSDRQITTIKKSTFDFKIKGHRWYILNE